MTTCTDILAALGVAGLVLGFLAWPASAALGYGETLRRRCKATWLMHALGIALTLGFAIYAHAARWPDVYWTAIPILLVGLTSLAVIAAVTAGERWRARSSRALMLLTVVAVAGCMHRARPTVDIPDNPHYAHPVGAYGSSIGNPIRCAQLSGIAPASERAYLDRLRGPCGST